MAELATIARPYAEALFKASQETPGARPQDWVDQIGALGQAAALPELRRFADDPKVLPSTVLDLMVGALQGETIAPIVQNLLRTVLENGRLDAMAEIAMQYRALVNARTGVADATIFSAFPLDGALQAQVLPALERRFGRKLNASVVVDPELIGGIRVVVGDEVLDTSVKARLQQMKAALTA